MNTETLNPKPQTPKPAILSPQALNPPETPKPYLGLRLPTMLGLMPDVQAG